VDPDSDPGEGKVEKIRNLKKLTLKLSKKFHFIEKVHFSPALRTLFPNSLKGLDTESDPDPQHCYFPSVLL